MTLYKGSTLLSGLDKGNSGIGEIYKGSQLIYDKGIPMWTIDGYCTIIGSLSETGLIIRSAGNNINRKNEYTISGSTLIIGSQTFNYIGQHKIGNITFSCYLTRYGNTIRYLEAYLTDKYNYVIYNQSPTVRSAGNFSDISYMHPFDFSINQQGQVSCKWYICKQQISSGIYGVTDATPALKYWKNNIIA